MKGVRRRALTGRAARIAAGGANAATLRTITISAAGNATTVTEGGTLQLSAAFANSVGGALTSITPTWSSSDPLVATVNGTGLVSVSAGRYSGVVTIFARVGNVIASYTLTVVPNTTVATVTVTPSTLALSAGVPEAQLVATSRNAQGRILFNAVGVWASSTPAAATVAAGGRVVRVAAGTTNVTFTAGGQVGTCAVTVS